MFTETIKTKIHQVFHYTPKCAHVSTSSSFLTHSTRLSHKGVFFHNIFFLCSLYCYEKLSSLKKGAFCVTRFTIFLLTLKFCKIIEIGMQKSSSNIASFLSLLSFIYICLWLTFWIFSLSLSCSMLSLCSKSLHTNLLWEKNCVRR